MRTPTPTPSSEKFTTTQIWCPHCSGDSRLQTSCNHEEVVAIDCPEQGSIIAGDYEYISLLGCGGMGIVYKCRNIHLDKIVAVKMLVSRRYREDDVVRFQQEARAAGKFNHPNLVSILDFGITSNAEPFMVMEFLDGQTLSTLIADNAVDLERMISIFIECSTGLTYAHQQGVWHRDLKPANIMILDTGGNLSVKVLDFGIAKIADAGRFEHTHTTKGLIFGTPAYMSPEQSRAVALTDRCDVYSLGCVMYEAFSGVRPFKAASALELVELHQFEIPQLIGSRSTQRSFPEELESLIAMMLVKDPKLRPSMSSVTSELEKILEQLRSRRLRSSSAAQGSPPDPSQPAKKKSPWPAIAAIACISVVIVGAVSFVFRDALVHDAKRTPVRLIESAAMKMTTADDVNVNRDHLMKEVDQQLAREEIKFRDDRILSEPLEIIAAKATNCRRIRFLDCNGLTPDKLKILSKTSINNVAIEGTELTDEAIEVLAGFKNLEGVEFDEVTGITWRGIASLKNAPRLSRLSLRQMPVEREIIGAISDLKISLLELSENPNFDETALGLLQNTSISILKLRHLDVTDSGLELVSKMPLLSQLDACDLKITNQGLSYLSRTPNLQYLDISNSKGITDGACQTLAAIVSQSAHPSHFQLMIGRTSITRASVPELKNLKGIKSIDLSGLKGIGSSVIKDLQTALPGTRIVYVSGNQTSDAFGILSN